MHHGYVLEKCSLATVFSDSKGDYTKLLLSEVSLADPDISLNPGDRKLMEL